MSDASADESRSPPDRAHQQTVAGGSIHAGAALPFGHRLQEYLIEGLLGEGGFGIVYLALDTRLGRNVALKEYMPANLAARGADLSVSLRSERHRETFELGLRSFVNEARLLASFDHPSLVKVYRFWEDNGTAYMVMPLHQGPTLKKYLGDQSEFPDEAWLRALLAPMLDVLEQLHHDHCYHRDIAPDNILLLPEQRTQASAGSAATAVRPLLLDFGAARRVVGDTNHALTVILKPGYAPIEQYANSAAMKQGPWTDVYALSAVLYACVTGRAPAPSVSRVIQDDMVPAAVAGEGRYSRQFLQAIDAGLAVRPEDRPPSMAALRKLFADDPQPDPTRTSEPDASLAADQTVGMVGMASVSVPGPSIGVQAATHPATPSGLGRFWVAGLAVAMLAAGGWWWLGNHGGAPSGLNGTVPPRAGALPAATAVAAVSAEVSSPPAPSVAEPAPKPTASPAAASSLPIPAPAAPTTPPFTLQAALHNIVERADQRWAVAAVPDKGTLTIGKDMLRFSVTSSEPGFLYVFHAGTDNQHFNLLFPNALDKNNRVDGGVALKLPRKRWEIPAEGPPGTNLVVALVSRHERDFGGAGLLSAPGQLAEFDLAMARQRWAQDPGGPSRASPFVGRAVCPTAPCDETYGASLIEIIEVKATGAP